MSNETSHHKWEKGIILLLTLDGWDLEWTGGEFEHFDARGKTPKGFDCVIEFKLRHSYYPTKVLEKYKYDKLMEMEDCNILQSNREISKRRIYKQNCLLFVREPSIINK